MKAIVLDFETRSRCDLKMAGAVVYARDPSTDVLCLALIDLTTDESIVFDPYVINMPKRWVKKLEEADLVMAHNALFDREIYNEVYLSCDENAPQIPFEKWYCTSAQARVNALPASLEDAARAAKLVNKKDFRGSALIRALSIPQADGTFNEDKKLMQEMRDYCLQDAKTTVDLVRATRLMTQVEHGDWLIAERMNMLGIKVDVELAELAQQYADEEQAGISVKLGTVVCALAPIHLA